MAVIRRAQPDDFTAALPLLLEAHHASPFGAHPYDVDYMRRVWAATLCQQAGWGEVVIHNGAIVGVLLGMLHSTSSGVPAATDIVTYAKRGTDRLLRHFMAWAEWQGVAAISITDISGSPRYRKLLTRLGLTADGITYGRSF